MATKDVVDRHSAMESEDVKIVGRTGRVALVVVGVVLALFAPVAQMVQPFWMNLMTTALIFALFALSLDFVFGYAGLLSFGHAAMFGAGGYAVALLLEHVTQSALVVLPLAVVAGVVVAALIGWLSVRTKGIYFAMLTLAFAQLLYTTAFNDILATVFGVSEVTAGDDGLVGIPSYELATFTVDSLMTYYYLALVIVALSFVAILRLANSPFGRALEGVRENEERMAFVGYNVRRYKIVAFAISGGFAGLAGGLFVPFQSTAHPEMLHWMMSGELIVMTLLGGMGTLWGPMVGAATVIFLEDVLSSVGNWEIILGSIYALMVIFAPTGIAGAVKSLKQDPRAAVANVPTVLRDYVEKVRG
ncbi:amino acid/amide ABC transporter membrane protein 2, HAAT family (TC 3.A.1.4.-) [Halogranum amylolyticum]|uniref:Amino acid/amide ABC transporter membrane protein 2, HAAT family (TC 3.A.1.4.-) n=1 Tax=Halogranum amylolyticum TaxID=660520 RepID=A0A1H8UC05_9EURY|nr:branched-chain amino acid ABC transporter permease [Halogranum amylolyticum]SEP00403.1 amino acid/amide ABC transporter membrane protein 2, HAAT family (TC 3.A.1.4.-) [Halogranum amylolyticum]